MRLFEGKLVFSAGDLVNYLGCKYATTLDYNIAWGKMKRPEIVDDFQVIIDAGLKHEEDYLQSLKDEGKSVFEVPTALSFLERVEITKNAMKAGEEIIYQGVLYSHPWHGVADFLVRVDVSSELGDFSYIPYDTKLKKTATAEHFVQLGIYAELVGRIQGLLPGEVHIVLGDGSRACESPKKVVYYLKEAMGRFEGFVEKMPSDLEPEPCSYCGSCSWLDICNEKWVEKDHLSQVANIRRSQIKRLEAAGIDTVAKLAAADDEQRVYKLSPVIFQKIKKQATMQFEKRESGISKVELLPLEEGRGFNRLPEPNEGDLFFDMEGDPLYPDGLEYLFGVYHRLGDSDFLAFWGHDREGERRAFEDVMDFFVEHLERYPEAHIYHYNHYEETALKRLSTRFGVKESELDDILRQGRFVDLFKVVREGIVTSEPGYSIKNLEVFYMEDRDGGVQSAAESIVFYERWRATEDGELLKQIEDYNYDDCVSTALCLDWLGGLRPDEASWFKVEVEPVKEEVLEQRTGQEAFQLALRGLKPVDGQPVGELMGFLCEFHRRELKPIWWKIFSLIGADEEELIEDLDCLAGLRQVGDVERVKRSYLATYKFPLQDTRLGKGARPFMSSTGEPAGVIEELDRERGIVSLKRGTGRGEMPKALSLLPERPIDARKLSYAIRLCASTYVADKISLGIEHGFTELGDLVASEGRFRAIKEFLLRKPARMSEEGLLEACNEDGASWEELLKAALGMNDTLMFIQGPPGCGKTYNGARVIVGLIEAGKKVAVSSNSHKAIINLLEGVEAAAEEFGVEFKGVKRSNKNSPDTWISGKQIRNAFSLSDIVDEDVLIGGTAWLMAEPSLMGSCDYLFVDEAGQVSLANLVAMSGIADNVVLLGDQMQLGQPIQGTHPGESGVSALEYLLQEQPVVSSEYGVFLNTTWRLHPNISNFISEAVYDGRLKARKESESQKLVLQAGVHDALKEFGISFWEVHHEGCSQKSEEEGQEILAIYSDLLGQQYMNRQGEIKDIGHDDIMVISPYNAQVNYLQEILPLEARIGTVDRFQGQEAEVVLISMATSDQEELPRNLEFLFSSNRLNVAVSRAKCLAVVLANPRLLEVSCRTFEQLALVNTLCHLKAWSLGISGKTR